ncbi:hypothetical protein LG272_10920 [Pseudidiomarina marina]|uniref:hypothetical protein n=1 Tax=Pseudidiomarina marina TaxID=502366 RepID=UPI00384A7B38
MRNLLIIAVLVSAMADTANAQTYQMPEGEQGYWKLEETMMWQLTDPAERGEVYAISKLNSLVKKCLETAACKGPLANRGEHPTQQQREAAVAAANLADLFLNKAERAGVERNPTLFVRLHTFANNLTYAPSTYALGRQFLRGGIVAKDPEYGAQLLQSALALGHIESGIELGLYYRSIGSSQAARSVFEEAFEQLSSRLDTPESFVQVIHSNLRELGYPLDNVLAERRSSMTSEPAKVAQTSQQPTVRAERVELARQCFADAENITRRDSALRRQLRTIDNQLNDVEGDINVLRNTRGTVRGTYEGQLESYARSGQFSQLEQERRDLLRERGYLDRELRSLIDYARSRQSECNLSLYRSEYDLVCKGNSGNSFCKGYDL